uniref:Small ribosomal subunit protein uS2c n=1 Tax=Euglenaformis proxima TaxID=299110 RepID=A0A023HI10_9EUGL|nr:ribosomal protein S2 [Euglenaformis proxima]AGL12014.1 ribosomal protein S2 [Euglenaformis proxima]
MISLEELLSSSVHLGHKVQQWNPKMGSYIYGERGGIHIIDILQTLVCLEKISTFLFKISKEEKVILIVGTKRQFSTIIKNCAVNCEAHYVTQRWLGGMLTNWETIKLCLDNLNFLLKQEENSDLFSKNKKENFILQKKKVKLEKYFLGIKDMKKIPDVVIIIGQSNELNAVKECIKLKIPLITILDTNGDPTLTDFVIPANDDSISSLTIILNYLSNVIKKAKIK